MEKLKKPWLIKRLAKMIENRISARGWPETSESDQFVLPGFEGMPLPRRIFLKNGTRKILDKATVGEIRQHVQMLRERLLESPKVRQMEKILELMEKYSKEKPRITWKEVRQKEFSGEANGGAHLP